MAAKSTFGNASAQHSRESVWDYPRPPQLERVADRLQVIFAGKTIASTVQGYRALETSHPPVYYVPASDTRHDYLEPAIGSSFCEFKGVAQYWTVDVDGQRTEKAAWSYPKPAAAFQALRDCYAFYASRVDECWVGEHRVQAQKGDFYGGWITPWIVGPFKGGPGTLGW